MAAGAGVKRGKACAVGSVRRRRISPQLAADLLGVDDLLSWLNSSDVLDVMF
jgi:hypothetical protein